MEIEKSLLEITGTETAEEALEAIKFLKQAVREQNSFISNMGLLSMVIGPHGLAFFMPSPGLIDSIEGLGMVDKALADFSGILAKQRKFIYEQVTQKVITQEKGSDGNSTDVV